ncbi:MAG TPA: hypothetical protein VG293_01840 [Solirubrobacteraceae bacterium]|jgi:hypothetical protein|nr:hypothetical protein [Solirubrobacteraceae bacterium]
MTTFAAGTAADLLRVVWSSIVASVVVSVAFSGAVVGLIRAGELRRTSRAGMAAAYTAGAIVALALCLVAVVYGVILVSQKS